MKLFRSALLLLILFLLAGATNVQAAPMIENWVTDPASGCRVGWFSEDLTLVGANWSGPSVDGKAEGKGTLMLTVRDKDGKNVKGNGEAEMKAGKLDGQVSLKWSDGDVFDGYYKEGLREGRGIYKTGDGRSFEGEFRGDKANGQGVLKDHAGVVVYEGEWKDNHPIGPPKTDKVLGIPWGAAEDEARKIMQARPGTYSKGIYDLKTYKMHVYLGTFNDELARIQVAFYQGKMFAVVVEVFTTEDGVMTKFDAVRQGLIGRYGPPFKQEGKYLDSKVAWEIGGGYVVAEAIKNERDFTSKANVPEWQNKPFGVMIAYTYYDTWTMLVKEDVKQSSRDY